MNGIGDSASSQLRGDRLSKRSNQSEEEKHRFSVHFEAFDEDDKGSNLEEKAELIRQKLE